MNVCTSYYSAVEHIAELAPSLDKASEVIQWAEPICDLLSFIYTKDYDTVTVDLYEAVKENQGYEDED